MSKTDTVQIENREQSLARQSNGFRRLLNVIALSVVWAFLSAGIVGSFAAAIWTVIPTDMLSWGANDVNLIGYVSHCPYVPVSTTILLAAVGILAIFAYRLKSGRTIGLGVFIGTAGGLMVGLLGGIDIIMFIGMGAGVGVGILLGLIIGLIRQTEV